MPCRRRTSSRTKCILDDFGDAFGDIDLDAALGNGPGEVDVVQVLVRLLELHAPRDSAADRHERIAFGRGGKHAGGKIRHPRTRRDQYHARLAGQPTDAARHEGCILLMPTNNQPRPAIGQRIEDPVDLGAGNAENKLDSQSLQAFDEQLGPRDLPSHCKHSFVRFATSVLDTSLRGRCPIS